MRYVYLRNTNLHSGPIDGSSSPVLISGTLASTRFELTPDGSSAVFLAAPHATGFFRAPLDGSAPPLPLTGALPAFANSFEWELTPDGTSLLYLADALQDGQDELFVAPLDGATPPIRLNAPLAAGTDVLSLRPTPDASRVLFVTGTLGGTGRTLFSVPIDASQAPLDLSGTWSSGRHLILTVSPDSSRAVFLADARTPGESELFSVQLDGSAPPIVLNLPLPFRGDVLNVSSEEAAYIDRASTAVFFLATTTSSQLDFYRAPLDGSSPAQLVGGAVPNSSGSVPSLQSPNRAWIAFERRVGTTTTLHAFSTDGSRPPHRLDGPTVPLGSVLSGSFAFTPDSRRVLYLADQDTDATIELYQSPLEALWRR